MALPTKLVAEEANLTAATGRTLDAVGPTAAGDVVQAVVGEGEVLDRFLESLGFGNHEPSIS
jgi:hypothetical protein